MSGHEASESTIGISFVDLLNYQRAEAGRWRAWLERQPPELLDRPFGDADQGMGSIRDMLWHIFIVQWVYACVMEGVPYTDWARFPRETVADLFSIGDQADSQLRAYLDRATVDDMAKRLSLSGRGVTIEGSSRKFLTHVFVHSLRHWAQVSTVLRQQGFATDWQHDFVLSDIMP
ncbi:MAG: DinB family protein [Vicinamibacterales bacterium]